MTQEAIVVIEPPVPEMPFHNHMRDGSFGRRRFLGAVAAFAAAPVYAAQAPRRGGRLARVGIYSTTTDLAGFEKLHVRPFIDEMQREFKWTENVNIRYERVLNEEQLPSPSNETAMRALAAKLVASKPDVIWVDSSESAQYVLDATKVIPVVGSAVSETMRRMWAEKHKQPGGNFTGVSNPPPGEMAGKRLQWLLRVIPNLRRVGLLGVPEGDRGYESSAAELASVRNFAATKSITVTHAQMVKVEEADEAFVKFREAAVQAVLVGHLPVFQRNRKRLIELAGQGRKIPLVGTRAYYVDDRAFMSFSTALDKQMRSSAKHVDRILNGSPPGAVPVETFWDPEVYINLNVADELGLPIPLPKDQYTGIRT